MHSTRQFLPVPLSVIDHEDSTYRLTLWEDSPDEALLNSVSRFGILHPPILRHKGNNSYCIVSGRKRIAAVELLAPEEAVICRIIPEDIDQAAIFALILEEAERGRPLSIVEQIIFFEKLIQISSTMEAIPLLEPLGYKPQQHTLDNLLKLRSLSEPALLALHRGTLQIKNAGKLLHLPETDQKLIIQLINTLNLGGSKQQKLIELCIELTKRKNISLEKILANVPSTDEQEQPRNIPQHGAALLLWLQNECFPQLSQAENEFQRQVARHNLPSSAHITHTPAFEDRNIILSLRFTDWHSLDKILPEINKLMQAK